MKRMLMALGAAFALLASILPGAGLGLEPRADFGRAQVGLLVSVRQSE